MRGIASDALIEVERISGTRRRHAVESRRSSETMLYFLMAVKTAHRRKREEQLRRHPKHRPVSAGDKDLRSAIVREWVGRTRVPRLP